MEDEIRHERREDSNSVLELNLVQLCDLHNQRKCVSVAGWQGQESRVTLIWLELGYVRTLTWIDGVLIDGEE